MTRAYTYIWSFEVHPEHVVAHRSEALASLTAQTAEAARRRIRASD